MKPKYNIVAAIIFHDGKYLGVKRGAYKHDYIADKYEFPGGKVEIGESDEIALCREIREELDMTITVDSHLCTIDHEYPHFSITMKCYICSTDNPEPTLTEHVEYNWIKKQDFHKYEWAAADIPVIHNLVDHGL